MVLWSSVTSVATKIPISPLPTVRTIIMSFPLGNQPTSTSPINWRLIEKMPKLVCNLLPRCSRATLTKPENLSANVTEPGPVRKNSPVITWRQVHGESPAYGEHYSQLLKSRDGQVEFQNCVEYCPPDTEFNASSKSHQYYPVHLPLHSTLVTGQGNQPYE
jgi:hypothetical protein